MGGLKTQCQILDALVAKFGEPFGWSLTGIHSKGWSEEEAVNYFLQNSDSSEATVKSEIQRYFTSPARRQHTRSV